MEKKSITILLPDLRIGGAERVTVTLANYLNNSGYRVTFLVLRKTGHFLTEINPEITVIDLKVKRLRYALFPLVKVLYKTSPDVLIAVMWPLSSIGVIAGRLTRKRIRIAVIDQICMSKEISESLKISLSYFAHFLRLFSYGFIAF